MDKAPQFRSTGETVEGIRTRQAKAAQTTQRPAAPQPQRMAAPAPEQHVNYAEQIEAQLRLLHQKTEATSSVPEKKKTGRASMSKRSRLFVALAAGVSVVAGGTAIVHATDPAAFEAGVNDINIFHIGTAGSAIEVDKSTLQGIDSLGADQQKNPESALMVVTVSGSMALPPELKDTNHKAGYTAPEYMQAKNDATLSGETKTDFDNHVTNSGYPEATLNNMPLAVKVWYDPGANPFTKVDGKITGMDESQFHVSFEDITQDLNVPIKVQWQTDNANVKTDASDEQYATMPDPAKKFFLGQSKTDTTWNAAVDTLVKNYGTDSGSLDQKIILYTMEQQAAQLVNNDEFSAKLDAAILARVGNPKNVAVTGSYKEPSVATPRDATTKLEITAADTKTGAPALQSIAAAKFKLESASIAQGYMKIPKDDIPSTPTPTATPTPSPSPSKK